MMGRVQEVLETFWEVAAFLITSPFTHPEYIWITHLGYVIPIGVLLPFILRRLLCPTFDPQFKDYLDDHILVWTTFFPSASARRAIQYAFGVSTPRLAVKMFPKFEGHDFRGQVSRATRILCFLQIAISLYIPLALLAVVAYGKWSGFGG